MAFGIVVIAGALYGMYSGYKQKKWGLVVLSALIFIASLSLGIYIYRNPY
ncbi:hypothetical protein KCG48_12635 [Proteiniclasticum sp. BAD-10]|uniref:Uncharacterized protein n=1 Tax=Proteiniclasticum sediminis TaxID=2804028 RepID=A0A941CR46_9CLOT|nr:hypothetical protein [Proteiniclasticum sediminis]MBR0577162.1 hypothetical protein [Proteiniclasticum sediminis]